MRDYSTLQHAQSSENETCITSISDKYALSDTDNIRLRESQTRVRVGALHDEGEKYHCTPPYPCVLMASSCRGQGCNMIQRKSQGPPDAASGCITPLNLELIQLIQRWVPMRTRTTRATDAHLRVTEVSVVSKRPCGALWGCGRIAAYSGLKSRKTRNDDARRRKAVHASVQSEHTFVRQLGPTLPQDAHGEARGFA